MKVCLTWLTGLTMGALLICPFVNGMEVVVMASDGNPTLLEVPSDVTLEELTAQLNAMDEGNWNFMAAQAQPTMKSTSDSGYSYNVPAGGRDFYYQPNNEEIRNISYVVKTLANKSEISLLVYAGSIETAGNNTAHIHPLKFLQVIFADEELKVGMRVVKGKSMVWKKFRGGIADSLADEQVVGNMHIGYLVDFCNAVGLNIKLVQNLYEQGQWKDFIDAVVVNVPRKGDHNRYDM